MEINLKFKMKFKHGFNLATKGKRKVRFYFGKIRKSLALRGFRILLQNGEGNSEIPKPCRDFRISILGLRRNSKIPSRV